MVWLDEIGSVCGADGGKRSSFADVFGNKLFARSTTLLYLNLFSNSIRSPFGNLPPYKCQAMCFFSMFLVTFFSPNLRGRAKKKNVQRNKNALTQCSRPPDRQMTHLAHCVERSHSFFFLNFFFFISKTMIKLNSFPVATVRKFDFFLV